MNQKKVLFLCTGNSCRSQMGEGWARALHGDLLEVYSAGLDPQGLNPWAIRAMKEKGIEVITLPEEERAQLVAAGGKYIDAWVEQMNASGMDGAALLDEYRGLITKYTEERDSKGYPWAR